MKKRTSLLILISLICVLFIGVGTTFAYIIASTRDLVNTFTIGNIELTLTETTGTSFELIPGVTHKKDPTVTVKNGSDDCWLFIKAEPSADLYLYASYQIDDGWIDLEGEAGVYYRKVYKAGSDTAFRIIKDNSVTIFEDLSEEELSFIRIKPTLKFKAYAVQMDGFTTPDDAWDAVIMEKGE